MLLNCIDKLDLFDLFDFLSVVDDHLNSNDNDEIFIKAVLLGEFI